MSSPPPHVWFLLLDSATGEAYKGTSASKVSVTSPADVDGFRDAVKAKHSNKLSAVDAADLLVYRNKAAFDKRNATVDEEKVEPLDPTLSLGVLGSKEDMLVVVVPTASTSSTTESNLTGKTPHPLRKRRWEHLNDALGENPKRQKAIDSTAYSYVSWNEVEPVFNLQRYDQPKQDVPDDQLNFLVQYLSFTTNCLGMITTGKEAKRLHFIAPVLICVCDLFKGDVKIVVEEDLVGSFVRAHGRFEFMLKRRNKVVCIVEAKKDNLEQGMAQDLVGCEVAAEVGGLNVVYGIVTNYAQWNFYRSLDDKVEWEECTLKLTHNGPERESLKTIVEKIYAMLSDDEAE